MPRAHFTAEVGVFRRTEWRHKLKEIARRHNLHLEVDEERGWLVSYFLVALAGDREKIRMAFTGIRELQGEG